MKNKRILIFLPVKSEDGRSISDVEIQASMNWEYPRGQMAGLTAELPPTPSMSLKSNYTII